MKYTNSNISIVTGTYGATTETFVTRHIDNLNSGKTVVMCNQYVGDKQPDKPVHILQKLWCLDYSYPLRIVSQIPNLFRYGYSAVPNKKEQENVKKFLRDNKVKCVLAEFGPLGCAVLPIAKKMGIPLFTYFRGYDASRALSSWKIRHAYRRLIPKMEGIIAVSPHLLENLKNIGVKWKQAHVIPSGTDVNQFKPDVKDPSLLLSVGRFVKKKAPDLTIHAFAKVLSKRKDLQLVMVGDGAMLKECKSLAASLGIEKSITFTGAQPNHVVRDYMARATLFLLHSVTAENGDSEGFPSVIQEAMASGAAVVSTNHGGIPFNINNFENGITVNEHDVNAYTNAIMELISDEYLLKEIQKNARKHAVDNFDYFKLYSELEEILN